MEPRRARGLVAGMAVGAVLLFGLPALGLPSSLAMFVAFLITTVVIVKTNDRMAGKDQQSGKSLGGDEE